ncbi:PH domain-containing protein [Streptomyces lonarensis]|uniref:PH domain-containing protein n=1 Tax=Streptomyces lonarensis TaxID=700599 RepID=A0A7X6I1B3_9ACTN|nr:PH domain-containing protein [Streptomyces lonarensis]NJQ08144.1 PH domain-containing protein [Streptomyces lonarensis]
MTTISLRPPRHRVQPRVVAWWTLRALCGTALAAATPLAAWFFWESSRTWTGPVAVAVLALGLLYAAVTPSWRYAVHRWETTDEAVFVSAGWFVRDWRIAPISRIQTVDTSRGPIEQLLGIATLVVTTASASGAVHVRGLAPDVARASAEQLAEITRRTPGDAT